MNTLTSFAETLRLTEHCRVCVASLMRIITIDLVEGGDLPCRLEVKAMISISNNAADTVITCYMWSQIEPTMAIVCGCLTTMGPLFTGFDLSFLSRLTWRGRGTFSSFARKSKGRPSDLTDDRGKNPTRKEEERTRPPDEGRRSDFLLSGLEAGYSGHTRERGACRD